MRELDGGCGELDGRVGGRRPWAGDPRQEAMESKKSAPPQAHPFSSCGFSLARGLHAGKLPKEPVWGRREKGKAWFWGSSQEPLIHPRTRSAFFFSHQKLRRKKK